MILPICGEGGREADPGRRIGDGRAARNALLDRAALGQVDRPARGVAASRGNGAGTPGIWRHPPCGGAPPGSAPGEGRAAPGGGPLPGVVGPQVGPPRHAAGGSRLGLGCLGGAGLLGRAAKCAPKQRCSPGGRGLWRGLGRVSGHGAGTGSGAADDAAEILRLIGGAALARGGRGEARGAADGEGLGGGKGSLPGLPGGGRGWVGWGGGEPAGVCRWPELEDEGGGGRGAEGSPGERRAAEALAGAG